MSNIVASNPTEDLLEQILTQMYCQIQGMSIADPKQVRLTDGGERGMTSTLKSLELMDPKILGTSPKSKEGRHATGVGNITCLARKA